MANMSGKVIVYDLIVIGAGAGAKIASAAVKLGLRVAHAEHGFDVFGVHKTGLGGTCLNRGCIPSKMLIHAADVAETIRTSSTFSIESEIKNINFQELVTRVEKTVDSQSNSINPVYKKDRDWIDTSVYFTGPNKLAIKGKDYEITSKHIVLAGGCVPSIPSINGLEGTPYITSTEALRLKKSPKSLIVLGGGYIAVELGHYFGALGVKMDLVVRSELLRTVDSDIKEEFQRVFKGNYKVHDHLSIDKISYSKENQEFTLVYTPNGKSDKKVILKSEHLLVATGVSPSTKGLYLEKTNVELTKEGFVKVDEYLRTTKEGIVSIGDMAGNYLFRHSANYEAEYLMEHWLDAVVKKVEIPERPKIDYTAMPWAVFSSPQVAGAGLSENELITSKIPYIKAINKYSQSAMGDALCSTSGFIKLLVSKDDKRNILGCFIVGHEASILIHNVIPIMRMNGCLDDLLKMIYIHPSLNEIVRNVARRAKTALIAEGLKIPSDIYHK